MAHSTVSDEDLLSRSAEVFRTYGFEGTSLARLSEATGLEKASLYHRFPGGKEQIALAVAEGTHAWLRLHVFEPLKEPGDPRKKLRAAIEQLRDCYADGTLPCAFEVLSLAGGSPELTNALKDALQAWIKAFTEIAKESGLPTAEARRRAEQAIVQIEGSLVVGRVLGDAKAFRRTLDELPALLTNE
ncbi:TetR/AcrR family transcriptional regulator [Tunturiibacter gelidoferens]|uniref:AcrR family transcriptional regulator n=1 Tax=Tunturiibacter gelidiferens TaxID=3069689 RepID=A0ACC5NT76_9BACT|nr:TetR/AcrR family transcriptional regulator [Edaphobacter lichenicola]MBB5337762.1 AcrR family transcriptional regulator [Edaphobacter lichenicola]